MSKQIGFDKLFDVASFDTGTKRIAELLGKITEEINKAKTSADEFTKIMGQQLKSDINKLQASSKSLNEEMTAITNKMNTFKATTSNTKKVISDYERENEKLRKELEKLKTAQTNVNKETKKTGQSINASVQSLLGVASGAAIAYRGIQILTNQLRLAIESTLDFEQAMKEVQAISRASAEELALLTENANRLGATTEKTAGQIAKLQKELGKLGFNTTEILASTDAIVDLSTATGEDLANSATVAAATLRAFGLEATEMNRVVDVMAGSFVRSGLDLEKFRESMKLVAPIARATNVDIETTTAALSKLADAGLSGSLAGTALRNLLSEMADPTSKLTKFLGSLNEEFVDGVNSSEEMIRAFKALRDNGVQLAQAVQMVDVRARPAFFTIMNQIDAVEGLALEYGLLNGEADKIAETMRDTLTNDIKIAESAFDAMRRNIVEEFTPAMREATQNVTLMSEFIRFLTDDLSNLESQTSAMSTTWNVLTDLLVFPRLWEEAFKDIEAFNSFRLGQEAIETTQNSLEALTVDLEKVPDLLKALEASNLYIEAEEYGAVGQIIKNVLIDAGAEYEVLLKKIENGTATEEQGLKALKSKLESNLKSIANSVKQQENKLIALKDEYDLMVEVNGQAEFGTLEFDKQNAVLQQIKQIQTFLENSADKQVSLNTVLSKLKSDIKEFTGDLGDKEKNNLKTLEEKLRLEHQIAEARIQGEIDFQKTRLQTESDPVKQQAIREQILRKEIELADMRYNHEINLLEQTASKDENYLLKRQVAYENYVSEVNKLLNGALVDLDGFQDTLVTQTEKQFDTLKKNSKEALDKLAKDWKKTQESTVDTTEDAEKEKWSKIQKYAQIGAQGLARITRFVFDNRQLARQNELDAISRWEEEQVRLAGDNEDAKLRIEERAEQRRLEIKRKQAQDNKKEAIFQIIIDTAQAVLRGFLDGGLPMAIVAGALGAAQLAIVASQPIPQFAKGTDHSPEGVAEVGEKGRELVQDGRTKKWSVTPDKSTFMYLPKGSKVLPNEQTEQILSGKLDRNEVADNYLQIRKTEIKKDETNYEALGNVFKKAVTEIPVNITNFDEDGVTKFIQKRSVKLRRLNKRY